MYRGSGGVENPSNVINKECVYPDKELRSGNVLLRESPLFSGVWERGEENRPLRDEYVIPSPDPSTKFFGRDSGSDPIPRVKTRGQHP